MLQQRQLRAAEVAHDTGNLLQDLKLASATISIRLQTEQHTASFDIRDLLLAIDTSVDAIDGLLVAIVAATQLDAGALRLKLEPTQLETVLDKVSKTLRARAAAHQIDLCVQVPFDMPAVLCDLQLLNRALLNLVGNAIKFTGAAREAGGRVLIAVQATGTKIDLVIADNGPGIAPAELRRLGQPFARSTDMPNSPTGFGLRLAFARGVIEQHPGGKLVVESVLGQGTVIRVQLQAVAEELDSRAVGGQLPTK